MKYDASLREERKEALLVYLWEAWAYDRRPRFRDFMAISGCPTTSTVYRYLNDLAAEGLVTRHFHGVRGTATVYTRGPRLGGIYRGRPMRVIDEALP